MVAQSSPRLPLTDVERTRLRRCRIKLRDIAAMELDPLTVALQCTRDRAVNLRALAAFQAIPSVGPAAAQWFLDLGFRSLEPLRSETGPDLLERLEVLYGHWMDPCVEDVLWCVVHHAKHPGSDKVWYDFTAQRKAHRSQHGYPANRPTRAWYDTP